MDSVGKQRVWDDVNKRYLIVNKTGLNWDHPRHMHINKERPTEKTLHGELSFLGISKTGCTHEVPVH